MFLVAVRCRHQLLISSEFIEWTKVQENFLDSSKMFTKVLSLSLNILRKRCKFPPLLNLPISVPFQLLTGRKRYCPAALSAERALSKSSGFSLIMLHHIYAPAVTTKYYLWSSYNVPCSELSTSHSLTHLNFVSTL